MLVKECYAAMNGDYEDVIGRLMNDERIAKYLVKFINAPDYQSMIDAFEAKDYETAFRNVHSLKGMSMNLGFPKLRDVSSELCEAVRNGEPAVDVTEMIENVTAEYNDVCNAIRDFAD